MAVKPALEILQSIHVWKYEQLFMSCKGSLLVGALVFDAVIWVWAQNNILDLGDIYMLRIP